MDAKKAAASAASSSAGEPEFATEWDRVLLKFFDAVGLHEARKGLELDMLVMNQAHEQEVVPSALRELIHDLSSLNEEKTVDSLGQSKKVERTLEERKVDYVPNAIYKTPGQTIRDISKYLAANRARNDQSNRTEFLQAPPPSKRRKLDETTPSIPGSSRTEDDEIDETEPRPTCARTDTIEVNRDIQMKYDIAKVSDGPLRQTTNAKNDVQELRDQDGQGRGGVIIDASYRNRPISAIDKSMPTLSRHPGYEERFQTIEDHLAIRYVPAPPEDLRLRVKAVEEHIIRLEKDYPPWAALHFNQPGSTGPALPRTTPIVIPSHLTKAVDTVPTPQSTSATASQTPTTKGRQKSNSRTQSTLYRAVMEKLEVQRALNESQSSSQ